MTPAGSSPRPGRDPARAPGPRPRPSRGRGRDRGCAPAARHGLALLLQRQADADPLRREAPLVERLRQRVQPRAVVPACLTRRATSASASSPDRPGAAGPCVHPPATRAIAAASTPTAGAQGDGPVRLAQPLGGPDRVVRHRLIRADLVPARRGARGVTARGKGAARPVRRLQPEVATPGPSSNAACAAGSRARASPSPPAASEPARRAGSPGARPPAGIPRGLRPRPPRRPPGRRRGRGPRGGRRARKAMRRAQERGARLRPLVAPVLRAADSVHRLRPHVPARGVQRFRRRAHLSVSSRGEEGANQPQPRFRIGRVGRSYARYPSMARGLFPRGRTRRRWPADRSA